MTSSLWIRAAGARRFVPGIAVLAMVVAPASASASHATARRSCHAPRLVGLTLYTARTRSAKAGCRLLTKGASVQDPTIQTVERQRTGSRRTAGVITVWLNPLCGGGGSALTGPPAGEPIVKPGPTELVTGLFLEGGSPLPGLSSAPECAPSPGTPWAGTISIVDPANGSTVATQTVAAGKLAMFDLSPGTYSIDGTFAKAYVDNVRITAEATVTIISGETVRQDISVNVP